MTTVPDSDKITATDAAKLIGLSREGVRKAMKAGRLPRAQVAGVVFTSRRAAEGYKVNQTLRENGRGGK